MLMKIQLLYGIIFNIGPINLSLDYLLTSNYYQAKNTTMTIIKKISMMNL